MARTINIHAIQTLPPSAINRDDTGAPKTTEFGGVTRARVSSQAWKFAIRKFFSENAKSGYIGYRSTMLPTSFKELLVKARPKAETKTINSLVSSVHSALGGVNTEEDSSNEAASSKALIFYSPRQLDELVELATKVIDGELKSLTAKEITKALVGKNTVDIAMFGRMMASNPELGVDAAVSVAHAIGVDKYTPQRDAFVGRDDILGKTKILGNIEFGSSTVYRYANINVDALIENLDGDNKLAIEAAVDFINAFVRSMPSGKQSSFASTTLPSLVLVTISDEQPISFANAFGRAVESDDIDAQARIELAYYASTVSNNYGAPSSAFVISVDDQGVSNLNADRVSLPELIEAVKAELG